MKNRISAILIAVLTVLALASCNAGGAGEIASAAVVEWLEGSVTVDDKQLKVGDEVLDGAVIVTGEDSLVELTFGDYRILRASANSRLVLDSGSREMILDSGAISVVQAKARRIGRNRSWQLRTPTTVAAVRGTFYYAEVEDPDHTYFCLCNGKIHLEDSEGEGSLDLEAHHHKAVQFIRTDDGVVYRDDVMKNHTDADMESLADKVHVPVDWTKVSE